MRKKRNEKEYCEKRSRELRDLMVKAVKANDKLAFTTAYNTAQRYMKRGELRDMMMMYITHWNN